MVTKLVQNTEDIWCPTEDIRKNSVNQAKDDEKPCRREGK